MEPTTRERILESAARVFGRHGYAKTSIDSVAAQAGVGKGTVYLYCKSKQDLFYQSVHRELRRWVADLSQGIDPMIDFSDVDQIKRTAEYCNQLPVHERSPWAGDLVFTAFSGSHQDAIKKGFEAMDARAAAAGVSVDDLEWAVPYLPIDPKDLGRSYEAVIRVNSQSGKGGVAYVMQSEYGFDLPPRMQIEFSGAIQRHTDASGKEVSTSDIHEIFRREYHPEYQPTPRLVVEDHTTVYTGETLTLDAHIVLNGVAQKISGTGNGPLSAFTDALAELRKYGIALTLTTQHFARISDNIREAILGNAGTMIAFRVGATDATILARQFGEDVPQPRDLVGLANHEIFVKLMVGGVQSKPFSARSLPP